MELPYGPFNDWRDPNTGEMIYLPENTGAPRQTVPCAVLSVSDVERLAKAGVAMKWEEIRHQVRPDLVPDKTGMFDCSQLLRPLVARLRLAHLNRARDNIAHAFSADGTMPYFLSAVSHGDKVYVFVAPNDKPPVILEDDANLYPSDALMAKLFLMDKFHKENK